MSYLGKRGVLCVWDGWHFCTPVLMNMSSIAFEVRRLSTFVFKKSSGKKIFTIIFVIKSFNDWNNVGPASQTVAQQYFTIGLLYRVSWVVASRGIKHHPHGSQRKHRTITQFCFNVGPASKTMGQYWNSIGWMPCVCWCGAKYTSNPVLD